MATKIANGIYVNKWKACIPSKKRRFIKTAR
jgi:hypothetical protein